MFIYIILRQPQITLSICFLVPLKTGVVKSFYLNPSNLFPRSVQVRLLRYIWYSYVCESCEKETGEATIVKAPTPAPVIKRSLTSASIVAHVVNPINYRVLCGVVSNSSYRIYPALARPLIYKKRPSFLCWSDQEYTRPCHKTWSAP